MSQPVIERIAGWIGGAPHATPRDVFDARCPATGRLTGHVDLATDADVDEAVRGARAALAGPWGRSTLEERAALLDRIADGIERRFDAFVHAEVLDTGKPVTVARAFDIPRGIANFRTFAALARGLGDHAWHTRRPGADALNYTHRHPVGVVGIICPWNLPLLLMTWKVAPALAMGNALVVKPSEETPRTATLLASVLAAVGAPPGILQVVHGFGGGSTGEAIVRHPGVNAISFTGESATGRRLMADAAPGLKPLSFELGGKNAAIVFEDADFDAALEGTVRSVFSNCGQVCLCSERVYVHRSLFDRFVAELARRADALRMGPPLDETTNLGPLISATQRDRVAEFVTRALADGAQAHTRTDALDMGEDLAGGFWSRPTVLTGLAHDHAFVRNEVFGPVCHVMPFDTDEEALALANDADYGLCAAVWTRDLARAHRTARRLRVGIVWVNDWMLRDLRTPFGGVGASGIGREGGNYSFDFYSEIQNICVRIDPA